MESTLTNNLQAILKDRKGFKESFRQGQPPQALLHLSNEEMAQFYQAAYSLFQRHAFKEAADAYLFLVALNDQNHDYWVGLGMATQMLGNYEGAIDAYELAATCELDNPVPYFYLAKCLFAIHDRENALEAIELALEYSADRTSFEELYRQAQAAKKLLEQVE